MGQVDILLQPTGQSVGDVLINELRSERWKLFRCGTAFAKMSGVRHLDAALRGFAGNGGRCVLSVGIDENGTSFEALSHLLSAVRPVGSIWIPHEAFGAKRTFHPKLYLFLDHESHPRRACVIIGSTNLTEGGLYSNHEASSLWRTDLASDPGARAVLRKLVHGLDHWSSSTNGLCIAVDEQVLLDLHKDGKLPTESEISAARSLRQAAGGRRSRRRAAGHSDPLASLRLQPPQQTPPAAPGGLPAVSLPQSPTAESLAPAGTLSPASQADPAAGVPQPARHRALVIDITQSQKTECYLAKTPVDEDPGFFGWPWLFTGRTTAKGPTGTWQPQRRPWPATELLLRDPAGTIVHKRPGFRLRMDRYVNARPGGRRANQDVRLGLPAELLRALPSGCILVMSRAPRQAVDYELEFLSPESSQWVAARAVARRNLPGSPRRFGWM